VVWFWALAAVVLGFDQWTKFVVCAHLREPLALVAPFLYLNRTVNNGAAWGIFPGQRLLLVAVSSCTAASVIFFRKKLRLNLQCRGIAFGILLGGVCGNLLDRLRFGAVIDFIDVRLPFYRWPTFNFSDAAICIGILILLFTLE
jgi:signal peptidase II